MVLEIKRCRDTFFVGCHLNCVHKIEKLMLFLDDILEPYRSDIILKLWMSEAWILRFENHYFVYLKSQGTGKWAFLRGTYQNSQNLTRKSLAIGDQEDMNDFKFSLFDIKL